MSVTTVENRVVVIPLLDASVDEASALDVKLELEPEEVKDEDWDEDCMVEPDSEDEEGDNED